MGLTFWHKKLLLPAVLCCTARVASAQVGQWLMTFLVSPRPTPFVADYERNPSLAALTVFYTGTAPRSYRIEIIVRNSQSGEIARVISPPQSLVGGPISQAFTATDMADWHTESSNAAILNVVKRTGVLPEGQYQLCARILDPAGVQQAQQCTSFSIVLPEPPRLIGPSNLARLVSARPMFQWTPVVAPPEVGLTYHVRIAELEGQQTPQTALNSNRLYYDGTVTGVPVLVYPVDALPLRDDHDYVWQVEAQDANGHPVARRNGQSEIWTFHPGELAALPTDRVPDTLDLIPGVARLRGIGSASVVSSPISYTVNGALTLDLLSPVRASIQVTAANLAIDRGALPVASITNGQLSGGATGTISGLAGARYLSITDLAYSPRTGLTLGAALALPGGAALPLNGRLQVTGAGVYGTLTARATGGGTLGALGQDPVRLLVSQATVSMPQGDVDLTGALELFGQPLGCGTVQFTARAGSSTPAQIACATQTSIPLVAGSTAAQLVVGGVTGTLALDLASGSFAPALTATAALRVGAGGAAGCGATMDLSLGPSGLTPDRVQPMCAGGSTEADFGWLALRLSNPSLQRLVYTPGRGGVGAGRGGGGFDFALSVDLAVRVPALGMDLPTLSGVAVSQAGFAIPATDAALNAGAGSIGAFSIRATRARVAAVTIPWTDWQAHSAQRFRVGLDATLALGSLAGHSPGCLTSGTLPADSVVLGNGQFAAYLATGDLATPCVIPLVAGAAFELDGAAGSLKAQLATANGPTTVSAFPSVRGAFLLSNYFDCGAFARPAARRMALTSSLSIDASGGLIGRVTGLAPPCPLNLSAVQLAISSGTLSFSDSGGTQQVVLQGAATGTFGASSPISGRGTASIDVLAGKWLGGSVTFSGPFRLDLPRGNPALSFRVPGATLDSSGLEIDGRASLLLPGGSSLGATFAHSTLNPQTLQLSAGQVLFDATFGIEAALGDGSPTWHAVAKGAPLDPQSALRVDLAGTVALTSAGLSAAGTGTGRLIYSGQTLDALSSTLSKDFALGLEPFVVQAGRADLSTTTGATSVAYVDNTGFHPQLGALAQSAIPQRLGLPTTGVAYIDLKDAQGTLLVHADPAATGGVHVYTAPGQTVTLTIPALGLGGGSAPQVAIALDAVIDPAQAKITSGFVRASVPAGAPGFDLSGAGLPFVIDTIAYDQGPAAAPAAGAPYQLTVGGSVSLFGKSFGAVPRAALLTIDGGGNVAGAVNVRPGVRIPLVSSSTTLGLIVNGVSGSVNTPLLGGMPNVQLAVDATVDVALGTGSAYDAQVGLTVGTAGVQVTSVNAGGASAVGTTLNAGLLQLALSNLRLAQLAYAPASGFSFQLLVDAGITVPALGGLTLPSLTGVSLTQGGIALPAISVPQIMATMFPAGGSGTVAAGGFTLTPLAFRMDAVQYDWTAATPPAWNFGMDLSLSLGGLPATAPAALSSLSLTILNAGVQNGQLTGTVQPRTLAQPIVLSAFQITGLSGTLALPIGAGGTGSASGPPAQITVAGSAVLPPFLRCAAAPDGVVPPTSDRLTLGADGALTGALKGLAPACPAVFGPLTFTITSAELDFAAATGSSPSMVLQSTGALTLAGTTSGSTVSATGSIGIDLMAGRVVSGSIAVNQPFAWAPAGAGSFPTFTVQQGLLDAGGFHLSGTGALALDGGGSVAATFQNLTLALPQFGITAGSATIQNGFTLAVGLGAGGGVTWRAAASGASLPAGATAGASVTAPQTVTLDQNGLSFDGAGSASLVFGGSTFASLSASFANTFTIALSPLSVKRGRASFLNAADTVAYIDSLGFTPGNVFGVASLPDKLGLPTVDVAYVQLKDASGHALVQTSSSGGTLHLTGQALSLVIPALAGGGSAPTATVSLDVGVNASNYALRSGSVTATAPSGGKLFSIPGLPVDVTGLSFAARGGGSYTFRLDNGRLALPASFGTPAPTLDLTNVTVGSSGLSGEVSVGRVATPYQAPAGAPPFQALTINAADAVTVQLTGADVKFGSQPTATIAALVQSSFFSASGGSGAAAANAGIYLTGTVSPTGVTLTSDASSLGALPLGAAIFTPQAIGGTPAVSASANGSTLTVTLNGSLAVPKLGSGVSFYFQGLTIGTGGVVLPSHASLSPAQGNTQQIQLWGLPIVLEDSVAGGQTVKNYYALALSRDQSTKVVTVEASGIIQGFLGHDTRFVGLQVASDGHLHLAAANLLGNPVTVVQDRLTLKSLDIRSDSLDAVLDVTLPAPMPTQPQEGSFQIAVDGGVSGGAKLSLYDDVNAYGSTNSAGTVALGPVGTLVLRHVGLGLNASAINSSEIDVNADLYFPCPPGATCQGSDAQRVVNLGYTDGAGEHAGLAITFGGSTSFGNVRMQSGFDLDFSVAKLTIGTGGVSLPAGVTSSGFALGLSGGLSVDVTAFSGSLSLTNLILSASGLDFSHAQLGSGSLSLSGVATVSISDIAFSATQTTIQVPGGSLPTSGSGSVSSSPTTLTVSSFLKFGASVTIGTVMSGTVDSLLFYKSADGAVSFSINHMQLSVASLINGYASMAVSSGSSGFSMFMAGSGQLFGMSALGNVALAGAFEKDNGGKTRMGLFISAGIPGGIPLTPATPAASLVAIGGGFFLNPEPAWLCYVATGAGVTDGSCTPESDPADWAVMLFGSFNLGPPGNPLPIANGSMLVTVTDMYLRLQGKLQLLGQPADKFTATADLYASWHNSAVTGKLTVVASYDPVLTANGSLDFFVYGNAAAGDPTWGVTGTLHANIVAFLKADADFFAGPPGFLFSINVMNSLPGIAFVSLDSVGVTLWYVQGQNFGAVAAVKGSLNVIPDVLSVSATLMGALIDGDPSFIYAEATVSVSCLAASFSGSVWVSVTNGSLDGGTGSDAALESAIAEAESAANQMQDAKNAAQAALAAAQAQVPAAVSLSSAELAAIYQNLQALDANDRLQAVQLFNAAEQADSHAWTQAGIYYRRWYMELIQEIGAPTPPTTQVAQLTSQVTSEIAALQAQAPSVKSTISAIETTLGQATQATKSATLPTPITQQSFAPPTTQYLVSGKDTVVRVSNPPGFQINTTAAQQAKQQLQQSQANHAQAGAALQARIAAAEHVLTSVRAVTTNGSGSLLSFAQQNAQVRTDAQHGFAMQMNYLYSRHDWATGALQALAGKNTQWITNDLIPVTLGSDTMAYKLNSIVPGDAMAVEKRMIDSALVIVDARSEVPTLRQLAEQRFWTLDHLAGSTGAAHADYQTWQGNDQQVQQGWNGGNGSFTVNADSAVQFYRRQSIASGQNMWSGLAQAGLTAEVKSADSAALALQDTAQRRLTSLDSVHAALSASLQQLYASQVALTSALYDIYDRYLTAYAGTAPSGQTSYATGGAKGTSPASTLASEQAAAKVITQYTARRTQLAQDLAVPNVTSAQVQATVNGYWAELNLTWAGSHPSGIFEYLWNPTDAGGAGGASWFSMGGSGATKSYVFAPSRTTATTHAQYGFGVRGGAGYPAYGNSSSFTITYKSPAYHYNYDTSYAASQGATPALPPSNDTPSQTKTVGSLAVDSTPPTTPVVSFAHVEGPTVNMLWTSDSAVDVLWSASDTKTGIGEYHYRVRPALLQLPGAPRLLPPAFTSAGGRTELILNQSPLTPTVGIYVDVQAKNGSGIWSAVGTSPELRLDVTPPVWPAGAALASSQMILTATTSNGASGASSANATVAQQSAVGNSLASLDAPVATTYPACSGAIALIGGTSSSGAGSVVQSGAAPAGASGAAWQGAFSSAAAQANSATAPATPLQPAPAIDITRPNATDGESGIRAYYWHLDTLPAVSFGDGTGWSSSKPLSTSVTTPTIHIAGGMLDYVHPFYVSVVAQNYAMLVSPTLVLGPFRLPDPSAPVAPVPCAALAGAVNSTSARLAVTLQSPASDPQSGIRGYAYRIRNVKGSKTPLGTTIGTVLRPFPTLGTYDWTGVAGSTAGVTFQTAVVTVNDGDSLVVDLRAENGQGAASSIVASGPIPVDRSAPAAPSSIAASYGLVPNGQAYSYALHLAVTVPPDTQSGIGAVQAAVGRSAGATDVAAWTSLASPHAGAGTYHIPFALPLSPGTYYVQVRSVNGGELAGPAASASFTVQAVSGNGVDATVATPGGVNTGGTSGCTAAQRAAHQCE